MNRAKCVAWCTVMCVLFVISGHAREGLAAEDDTAAAPSAAETESALTASEAARVEDAPDAPAPSNSTLKEPATPEAKGPDQATLSALARAMAARSQESRGDRLKIGDICDVKHYKQETLQGFGLVLDLEGLAGRKSSRAVVVDTTPAEAIQLPELLQLLNEPVEHEGAEPVVPQGFWEADRVTLVNVTATVPPEGVCEGDRIDCEVKAFNGASLENGFLLATQLFTPGPKREAPLAQAAGPIVQESSIRGGSGKVAGGCLVSADICDQFVKDEKVTLILDQEHADFLVAQDIANLINSQIGLTADKPLAKALNRYNVAVAVPESLAEDPVLFVTQILQVETQIPAPEGE